VEVGSEAPPEPVPVAAVDVKVGIKEGVASNAAEVGVLIPMVVGDGLEVAVGGVVGLVVRVATGAAVRLGVAVSVASPPKSPPRPPLPLAIINETETAARQRTSKPPPANQTHNGNRRFLSFAVLVGDGVGVLAGIPVVEGRAIPAGAAAMVAVAVLPVAFTWGGGGGALTGCLLARRDKSPASPAPVA